ncbi:MAG: PAS domain-containing protein [Magnetococcales bacterium]|nr:PAS domain-containing protein [Magnetococcales bacterium]
MDPLFNMANLFDQLTTGCIAMDARGIVRAANSAAERLLGKPRSRLEGSAVSRLLPGHPVALELVERAQKLAMPCRARNTRIHPGPEISLLVSMTAAPLLGEEGGAPRGVLLQIEEVGEAERLEEGQRLHDTLDSLGNLALAVAHEVKNPLAGIRGAAQLLEMENTEGPNAACTALIRSEVDRISRLLDSLLGLADDHPTLDQEVNIHEVLDHVMRLAGHDEPEPVRDYDPSLPFIRGDRDQLVQVFLNLVHNAREACGPHGEVRLMTRISERIRLEQGRRSLHVMVEVRDSGPGIPDELRHRIFVPFVSTKPKGMGLGLSISQKIIHSHAGLIELDSQPGQTVFRVLLPVPRGKGR